MSGPQARRDQSLDTSRSELLIPSSRRYADPLGESEARANQSSGLVKQNEFLKSYISRLQQALSDSIGSFPAPPDPSTITEHDSLPAWGSDVSILSPLFLAYDRRIAEADQVNDRMSVELSSLAARTKQLSQENDRLAAEVKQLTDLAISRLEEHEGGQGKHVTIEMDERNLLLASENQALVEENNQLRAAISTAQREMTTLKLQVTERDEQNALLRAKVVGRELIDEHGPVREALAHADSRANRNDRVQMELEAAQRELRVLTDELQHCRNDLRTQVKSNGELRETSENLSRQLSAERARAAREHEEARQRETTRVNSLSQAKGELEDLKARRADEQRYVDELKRQMDDLDKMLRTQEQRLTETRAREEALKGQCRRLEEMTDEANLASDQAQALEQQARREIGRLSDKLRQVLIESQARSEETVMSIRNKYKGQKANLQQQVTSLEIKLSEMRTENDRLQRDKASLESEMEKLIRDGPGGNIGRLQREIDELNRKWREASAERDAAVHTSKGIELSSRRQQSHWEQEHLQKMEQISILQRQLKRAEERAFEAEEQRDTLKAQVDLLQRREKTAGVERERQEQAFEERMKVFSERCREQVEEMEEKVRHAEGQEQSARDELQELLSAHDQLQGKWREASKEIALQSQRCIEELRTEKARLEARNKELNNKLATALVERAGTASITDQHERAMARMRVLLEAAERRAQEQKDQVAELLRQEASLIQERKEAIFGLERKQMELERAQSALADAKETIKKLRSIGQYSTSLEKGAPSAVKRYAAEGLGRTGTADSESSARESETSLVGH